MHLHDLLRNGESETRSALSALIGAVDLVEPLENPRLMFLGDAGPGISHRKVREQASAAESEPQRLPDPLTQIWQT